MGRETDKLGHYDAVRVYHENAQATLRIWANTYGRNIDGWHYSLTRTPVDFNGVTYLAIGGTVIARCVDGIFLCLRFSISLQDGQPVRPPHSFPLEQVRRVDSERAIKLNFTPETERLEATPVG